MAWAPLLVKIINCVLSAIAIAIIIVFVVVEFDTVSWLDRGEWKLECGVGGGGGGDIKLQKRA